MSAHPRHFELKCRQCQWRLQIGVGDLLTRLRASGKMRRSDEPDVALLVELAKTATKSWCCEKCEHQGLAFREVQDNPDDWNDARACEACGQLIPPERVELYPDSTLCAGCQRKVESGQSPAAEYCPRCGSILQLRPTKSAGISRYAMYCASCRR